MVALVLFTILIIIVSWWCIFYYKYNRYLKQYPGPLPVPVFGNALIFGNVKQLLQRLADFHKTYGPIVKMQILFLPPVLQIIDPKLVESVLSSTKILHKGQEYKYFVPWLGTGLLTDEPVKWKHHRKILTPAFHFQILEQFMESFNLYSEALVDKLNSYQEKNSINIYPLISLCSLDIICETSMGTKVHALKDENSEYVKAIKDLSQMIAQRIFSIMGASDITFPLTPYYRTYKKTIRFLHDYTKSVIASRKQVLEKVHEQLEDKKDDEGIKKRNTFLDTLLKYRLDGGSLTDQDIQEEVDTFMFAGHDTTSSAIGFTLYSIANNPQVQQKCVEELNNIFGEGMDRPATSRDLNEMKYLEMVIKESLRLYPPVPIISRSLAHDTEFDGAVLPKNLTLRIPIFAVHRNSEVYPDPEKFDPERFTQENQAKRSPYAYIPFSAGPRNCIGQKFAMMELKVVIAKVLRTFELLPAIPAHELVLRTDLTLVSDTGMNIRLQTRKW